MITFAQARDIARQSGAFVDEGPGYVSDVPWCAAVAEDAETFETIERYWNDPAFAAEQDADRRDWQERTHALIDEGMRLAREKRERGE